MKGVWGVWVKLHSFLNSAVDGEWSNSRPGRFIPRNVTAVPIEEEVGLSPESRSGPFGLENYLLSSSGFEHRAV